MCQLHNAGTSNRITLAVRFRTLSHNALKTAYPKFLASYSEHCFLDCIPQTHRVLFRRQVSGHEFYSCHKCSKLIRALATGKAKCGSEMTFSATSYGVLPRSFKSRRLSRGAASVRSQIPRCAIPNRGKNPARWSSIPILSTW